MVPRAGIEPATCPLGGGRAIHCATGACHGNSNGGHSTREPVLKPRARADPHRCSRGVASRSRIEAEAVGRRRVDSTVVLQLAPRKTPQSARSRSFGASSGRRCFLPGQRNADFGLQQHVPHLKEFTPFRVGRVIRRQHGGVRSRGGQGVVRLMHGSAGAAGQQQSTAKET